MHFVYTHAILTQSEGRFMRKKLIEVALPLEAINQESVREKSIRHGHPWTLHLWWSRKPLATCRAVLFASLVDDPSAKPDAFPTEEAQERERQRLFRIIENLVKWENSNNKQVLEQARAEIRKSCGDNLPSVLDPFCGGGSIPLEAQRLGLEAHAGELNPVAVLITKALIEVSPGFAGQRPVHPTGDKYLIETNWHGAKGLAEDVLYYGHWMRDEAEQRIGHLYPKVNLAKEHAASEARVIAWLYCRAVRCPNPSCRAMMPLASKFWLSTKPCKKVWAESIVDRQAKTVHFEIKMGQPDEILAKRIGSGTGFINDRGKKVKATFRCIICEVGVAQGDYIDTEANEGRMGIMPLAIVAEGKRNRVYLPFDNEQREIGLNQPRQLLSDPAIRDQLPIAPARGTFASNAQGRMYGFKTFADYFTSRQLVALITFTNLVDETRKRVLHDAVAAGLPDDGLPLRHGGAGATAYAEAVAVYLALSF
jgi:putative DNA methylase